MGKIVGYIVSGILIFFGILYLWSSPEGDTGTRLLIGGVLVALGLIIIFAVRMRDPKPKQVIVHEVDLPGDISLEQMRCRACAAPLRKEDVGLVQGALVVKCSYCSTSYQIEEEPKW